MIDLGKNHHVSFSMHNFLENQSWTITLTRPLSALQSSQCEQRHHHRHKLSGRQIRRFKTRWRFSREDLTQKKKDGKIEFIRQISEVSGEIFPQTNSHWTKRVTQKAMTLPPMRFRQSITRTHWCVGRRKTACSAKMWGCLERAQCEKSVRWFIHFIIFICPPIHSWMYIKWFLLDIQIVFCVCFWTPTTSIISVFPNRTSMTAPFGCQHEGHLRSPECRRFVWK